MKKTVVMLLSLVHSVQASLTLVPQLLADQAGPTLARWSSWAWDQYPHAAGAAVGAAVVGAAWWHEKSCHSGIMKPLAQQREMRRLLWLIFGEHKAVERRGAVCWKWNDAKRKLTLYDKKNACITSYTCSDLLSESALDRIIAHARLLGSECTLEEKQQALFWLKKGAGFIDADGNDEIPGMPFPLTGSELLWDAESSDSDSSSGDDEE